MSHKYREGDRVRTKASPYPGALDNGKLGTVTKVTELRGETHTMHVLMDDTDQRSRNFGGAWCLYPHEIEPAPKGKPRVDLAGIAVPKAANWQVKTCRGVVSGLSKAVDNLPKPGTEGNPVTAEFGRHGNHKWQTPGVYPITSYRSFRRYRAAGAAFGVVVFDTQRCLREADPVNVSVRVARRRAQAGLALVAIVSEVNA
ncbi:hypothetical protein [Stenotrophomonas phage BUCT603]|nr:hypothetical protein [Stenotrophomonas phage BUCT603]